MNPVSFIKEVRTELKKVTWPTRAEVIQMTGMVIVVSLAVGVYIGILDISFAKLLETVIQ